MWLNMQHAVDLWEARAVHGHEYKKIQHSDGWRTGHHKGGKALVIK
jgi:plasmid maintenance system antidote protein VapI